MDLQIWAAVLLDFLFLSRRNAGKLSIIFRYTVTLKNLVGFPIWHCISSKIFKFFPTLTRFLNEKWLCKIEGAAETPV